MEASERHGFRLPIGDLEAMRLRHELATDAAAIGGFDWDLTTDALEWDSRMKILMGTPSPAQPTVTDFVDRILPADRDAVAEASRKAIRGCGDLRVEFRVIDEAGATRWLTTRGRVLGDDAGHAVHMLGAVFDSSSVRKDREQAARALDTMATAYATVATDWTVSYANQAARVLLAREREPVGTAVWDLVPGLREPSVARLLREVMAARQPATMVLRSDRRDGWFEISAEPVANGIAVLVSDVTARRRAQNEAEQAAERLSLLAQAGTTLMQPRPVNETVDAGLGLLVPRLAAAAMIYLREDGAQQLKLVELRHEDPRTQTDLRTLFEALPLGDDPATATGRAVATRTTQIIGDLDPEFIARATRDPDLRARLEALGATGVLAVPLTSRGESIGFIGLLGSGGHAPSGPDLVLIEDIASRVASAIDNAQILGQMSQARASAESGAQRLEFLANVADALGSTLRAGEAAGRLARILVPHLADWSMVTLLDDDGLVEDIASRHRHPGQQELLDRYTQQRRTALLADPTIIGEVVGLGRPLFQLEYDAFVERLGSDGSQDSLAELSPGVVTAVPILARDRTLGVISLYNAGERGFPSEAELDAAREVARRAGLVLENARLYARSRSMAETLQRSLLTRAVEPPDLQIATRYAPAISDARVGGDWYDAFQTGDGTTTLVIGDVMGHDTEAAALMGQLRTLVRAIAVDRGEAPSAVLTRVDAAAGALGVDTTATVVLAQVLAGAGEGGGRRLRWSNAGHPPPVLLTTDGTVRVLETPADLLIGFGGRSPRADHIVDLPVGSTVLMFTDGLVEGRAQPLENGVRKLAFLTGSLAALPLEDLCTQLLSTLEADGEDDIALVAVRIQPAGS